MHKNTEHNVESNKSNKNSSDLGTKEIDKKQAVENKNQVELNDNEKINNVYNKNSNLDEENLGPADLSSPGTQNMEGNIEEADKINENKNLNSSGTQKINKEQTVENKNQVELNDSKKTDNVDNKNSDLDKKNLVSKDSAVPETKNEGDANQSIPNQGEDEAELTNKIKEFISHAATLTLTDYRKAYVKIEHDLQLSEEEGKQLRVNTNIPDDLNTNEKAQKLVDILLTINKDNANNYGVDPKRLDETKFIVSRMLTSNYRKKIVESMDTNIVDSMIAKDIIVHTMYGGILQADVYVRKSKFLKDPEKFAKVYEIITNMTEESMYEYVDKSSEHNTIKHYKLILSLLCMACEGYKERQKDVIKGINDRDILEVCHCRSDKEIDIVLNCNEIENSISDKKVFNKLRVKAIIIQMIKENEQSAGNVPQKYEEFLCQNERANEKLLLEIVAQINKNDASEYGITNVEDLDKKKFIVASFFNDENGRSRVGQSIGEEKLLDIFFKMSEVEKMTYFRGLPRSIRTVKTLESALGNTRWWKDELNQETGKMEPSKGKKALLSFAVDYVDPNSNNQNNWAGRRFDFAEYMRQMNNLFQNMFMQWQMQQQRQMQQRLQQQMQYSQWQMQQRQMQQQRIQQMFNTNNEERELNQLITRKESLETDCAIALNNEEFNNKKRQELNTYTDRKEQLETQYSDLEKSLLEYTNNLINHMSTYINSYEELPGYAKSENKDAEKLYNICQKLFKCEAFKSGGMNSDNLLSALTSLQNNISEDMKQIESAPQLSFGAKQIYAKNFGLSLYYFFGIDAFARVISGSKNKQQTGELSGGDKNTDQSWDKLFIIDAFAFLIGISMIGLFIFMNLAAIAYISIAITAAEQAVTTILKLYRLNHTPRFVLREQAVINYNEAAQSLFDDINNFLSGEKSQEYSSLIGVKTELDDINSQIDDLKNDIQKEQSQTHPDVDIAGIKAELKVIDSRINVLKSQIDSKEQQQRQSSFGMPNNNMFGARIPNMCNEFNNNYYNNNGFGY